MSKIAIATAEGKARAAGLIRREFLEAFPRLQDVFSSAIVAGVVCAVVFSQAIPGVSHTAREIVLVACGAILAWTYVKPILGH